MHSHHTLRSSFVIGTTDCLGHVALITEVMLQLGMHKPQLHRSVCAVFIANEENGAVAGIGALR